MTALAALILDGETIPVYHLLSNSGAHFLL
jgi:hypothetical protein